MSFSDTRIPENHERKIGKMEKRTNKRRENYMSHKKLMVKLLGNKPES
jgi:hypothetical protein